MCLSPTISIADFQQKDTSYYSPKIFSPTEQHMLNDINLNSFKSSENIQEKIKLTGFYSSDLELAVD